MSVSKVIPTGSVSYPYGPFQINRQPSWTPLALLLPTLPFTHCVPAVLILEIAVFFSFSCKPLHTLCFLWNTSVICPLPASAPLAISSSSFRSQGGLFHSSLLPVMLVTPSLCSHSPCSSPKVAHATFYYDI